MITNIETANEVKEFAKQLINEGVNIHPDVDFNDYVSIKTNTATYTKEEADLRNDLMNQCFEVCEKEGIDIYDTMHDVTLTETGMDQLIAIQS